MWHQCIKKATTMYISTIKIRNYKSFRESTSIPFTPGLNIIVGKNNAGKSALIEALSLSFINNPHRSIATLPRSSSPIKQEAEIEITFAIPKDELEDVLINNFSEIHIPVEKSFRGSVITNRAIDPEYQKKVLEYVNDNTKSFPLSLTFLSYTYEGQNLIKVNGESEREPYRKPALKFSINKERHEMKPEFSIDYQESYGRFSMYDALLAPWFKRRIYMFKAYRPVADTSPFGVNTILALDMSNLAEVLNVLQDSPSLFQQLNKYINSIFPDIHAISVRPIQLKVPDNTRLEEVDAEQRLQIRVWPIDPTTNRNDLVQSLSQVGTGVSQVLALLYVILASRNSRIIIIDEPQSFLHPGAIRKVFEILKQFSQHQYIITTHSSVAVNAGSPQNILLVQKEEMESRVTVINAQETKELAETLADIGTRLSDVFGADNILWVEGETEEICFPLIIRHILRQNLYGTQILAVLETGDLTQKHVDRTYKIYAKLSRTGPTLLPPALGFIFDREDRTLEARSKLENDSGKLVHFTKRKMYENYLLNAQAITAIIAGEDTTRSSSLTVAEVELWLDQNRWNVKYISTATSTRIQAGPQPVEEWLVEVDGAKLLTDLFAQLSENRVNYGKKRHGELLTQWLIGRCARSATPTA